MFNGKVRTITALEYYCCFSWKLFIYKRGEWMVNGCKHETKPTRSEGKVNGNIWRRTQRYKQRRLDPKDSAKFYIVKLCNILNINKPPPCNVYSMYPGASRTHFDLGGGGSIELPEYAIFINCPNFLFWIFFL